VDTFEAIGNKILKRKMQIGFGSRFSGFCKSLRQKLQKKEWSIPSIALFYFHLVAIV
jgi:hypothetical protein